MVTSRTLSEEGQDHTAQAKVGAEGEEGGQRRAAARRSRSSPGERAVNAQDPENSGVQRSRDAQASSTRMAAPTPTL
jgi:hypothetical protein